MGYRLLQLAQDRRKYRVFWKYNSDFHGRKPIYFSIYFQIRSVLTGFGEKIINFFDGVKGAPASPRWAQKLGFWGAQNFFLIFSQIFFV